MVVKVLICVHYAALLWFYIHSLEETEDTWIKAYYKNKDEEFNHNPFDNYLLSIYYIITTFSTVGYGDITPVNVAEYIYTIWLMFFGVGFYSYFIGKLT